MFAWLMTLLALLVVLGTGLISLLFIIGYIRNRRPVVTSYAPSAAIIVPCKGLRKNIEGNLNAFCQQSYPWYQVIFTLDAPTDPAASIAQRVAMRHPHAAVIFSGETEHGSGKIKAMMAGIQKARDVEVFVFSDSDICPHSEWLRLLIAPLADERIGASTGYRWFFASNWHSALISTWNMSTLSALFYPSINFAWGGGTAIRALVFERLGIANRWQSGFCDDLILTDAVKKAQLKIRFVPQCIADSPVEDTVGSFVRWGNRQLTWARWYSPVTWFTLFIGILSLISVTLLSLFSPLFGLWLPFFLIVFAFLLEMVYGWIGLWTCKRLMRYPKERFRTSVWYGVWMPIVFFLYGYNAVVSSIKNTICWAGRTYDKADVRRGR